MAVDIEYKIDGQVRSAMRNVEVVNKDAAVLIAQKYMGQFKAYDSASVLTGETETVVSRVTNWMSNNG